jgi:uncharacterized protein (DUF2147 family)
MLRSAIVTATVLASLCPVAADAAANARGLALEMGTWINPKGNVKVETGFCGSRLCGKVIWANPHAEERARQGGVAELVGLELLHDYRRIAPENWQGEVFVPDMGRRFASKITQIDANTLKISGCILGGLICKSQVWHRI